MEPTNLKKKLKLKSKFSFFSFRKKIERLKLDIEKLKNIVIE